MLRFPFDTFRQGVALVFVMVGLALPGAVHSDSGRCADKAADQLISCYDSCKESSDPGSCRSSCRQRYTAQLKECERK